MSQKIFPIAAKTSRIRTLKKVHKLMNENTIYVSHKLY